MKPGVVTIASLSLFFAGYADAKTAMDRNAAINRAVDVCGLTKPKGSEDQWQAVLVKDGKFGDEWHVWLGRNNREPTCNFYGAFVKADWSYTGCAVSKCKPAR